MSYVYICVYIYAYAYAYVHMLQYPLKNAPAADITTEHHKKYDCPLPDMRNLFLVCVLPFLLCPQCFSTICNNLE